MAAWIAIALLCQYRDLRPWHDQGTFFQAAIQRSPDSAVAIAELARIRAQEARQGRPEEMQWALSGFLRAVALTEPSRREDLRPIRRNAETEAATILLAERQPEAVVKLLQSSPNLDDAPLANAFAGAEMALHHDEGANAVLMAALRAHPRDYGLHARLAWLLASQNECGAAKIEEDAARADSSRAMAVSFGALKAMLARACGE